MLKFIAVAALVESSYAQEIDNFSSSEIDQHEIKYDSEGNKMRLLKDEELYGGVIPKSFWTKSHDGDSLQKSKGPQPGREHEDLVVFRSHHGAFMRADEKYLNADKQWETSQVGPQNKFLPVPLGGNVVALKTYYNKYVVCENGGSADANRGRIGAWEKFKVYKNEKCKEGFTECVSFYNESHKYWLTADSKRVMCNRKAAAEWEKWYGWDFPPVPKKFSVFEEVMKARLEKLTSAVESAQDGNIEDIADMFDKILLDFKMQKESLEDMRADSSDFELVVTNSTKDRIQNFLISCILFFTATFVLNSFNACCLKRGESSD